MYHFKLLYHVEIFRKKMFLMDVKVKYFFGDQNLGRGDRMGEAQIHSERHGDGFAEPGGSSELVFSILHVILISKRNFLL